jgi:hypothetical protein
MPPAACQPSAPRICSPSPTCALRVPPLTRHSPLSGPQKDDARIKLAGYNCMQIIKDIRTRIIVCLAISAALVIAGIVLVEVVPSSKDVGNRHPAFKWVPAAVGGFALHLQRLHAVPQALGTTPLHRSHLR